MSKSVLIEITTCDTEGQILGTQIFCAPTLDECLDLANEEILPEDVHAFFDYLDMRSIFPFPKNGITYRAAAAYGFVVVEVYAD